MIGTLDGFRTYATARGHSEPWQVADSVANAALERASDHIVYAYQNRFASGIEVPEATLHAATYEAALHELRKPGFFNQTYTPGERKVLVQAGDIRWQVIPGSGGSAMPVVPRIDAILKPYMRSALTCGLLRA